MAKSSSPLVELGERYRIMRELGQGGMGQVYEATDLQLNRRVAVKLIRDDIDDEETRARFIREARAAAALSHPHACQLYEVGEHDGRPFLVMELLDGETLAARLKRGPMGKDEALEILAKLLDVLTAFHHADLVHRDLKPANVFLTDTGLKLLDFGLARRVQQDDALTTTMLTSPGVVTGTMRYMAPEQIAGDAIDGRTDIFALGVLLFEMLTGSVPFEAESNAEWLTAVLTDDPPGLGRPDLTELDPLVQRALQRRPQDRFQTAEEMAAAVDAARSGRTFPASGGAPASVEAKRAVILPFRLLPDDTDLSPLRDGLPEALTAALAGKAAVSMVSNRVAQAHSDDADLVAVGKALGLDRLLTGTVLRDEEKVRVTVQWVAANDGTVLWSQTFEYAHEPLLSLQDHICTDIVEALPLN